MRYFNFGCATAKIAEQPEVLRGAVRGTRVAMPLFGMVMVRYGNRLLYDALSNQRLGFKFKTLKRHSCLFSKYLKVSIIRVLQQTGTENFVSASISLPHSASVLLVIQQMSQSLNTANISVSIISVAADWD